MTKIHQASRAAFILCFTGCFLSTTAKSRPPHSPTVTQLLSRIENISQDTKDGLREELMTYASERGFPLAGPDIACFVYGGSVTHSIFVAGDFNGWDPVRDGMVRIEGTDFFYKLFHFPPDARLDYKFVKDGQWMLDPLNPRTVMGEFGPNSELRMPQYQPAPEIEYYPEIPHGNVEELNIAGNTGRKTVFVYVPPRYSNSQRYPVLYVHDGGEYLRLGKLANVMDYLLAKGEIAPLLVILVDPTDRNREYAINEEYRRFIMSKLIPLIDETYSTTDSPSNRCIMGVCLGGLASLHIAMHNSDYFSKCAVQSAPFRYNQGSILSLISEEEIKPVRMYVDCGTFETSVGGHDILEGSREAKQLLTSKGYQLSYHEYNEGHSWGNWRTHLDDILKIFFSPGHQGRR